LTGKGNFVGAFCSSNLGDVSPNIMGAKCLKTGLPCDPVTSACPDKDLCVASGPGKNIFESTQIIGTRIYNGASKLLLENGGLEVKGSVQFIHQFVDMTKAKTTYFNAKLQTHENVTGCLPAMGYSFAAGTTDGPGAFDFRQGTISDNPFWNTVRDFIAEPTKSDIKCQSPKPILLSTGRANYPYTWQPTIVPTQLFTIGDVMMFAVPGEFTTMSGRRLRQQAMTLMKSRGREVQPILCGLSNSYSSYVTTPEEYEIQRYEGASTIFGPFTLPIYIHQFTDLMNALVDRASISPGPYPVDQDQKQISLITNVYYDGHPYKSGFGYVTEQPRNSYSTGETATATFVSGNPRNNLMTGSSYFFVERLDESGNWQVVATDADW
jgi:neutral ceramidase